VGFGVGADAGSPTHFRRAWLLVYLSFLDMQDMVTPVRVFFLHLEVVFAEECLLVVGVYFIYVWMVLSHCCLFYVLCLLMF
jgi:hypothetical protein